MPDTIAIRDLHAQNGPRAFVIDLVLEIEDPALATDCTPLAQRAASLAESHALGPQGPLARKIADMCLAHPTVREAQVTVHEPRAQLGPRTAALSTTHTRRTTPHAPGTTHLPKTMGCVQ